MAHGLKMPEREVAFVTGAARGIGAAVALALAARGIAIGLTARKQVEAERVAAEIGATGGRAIAAACDVTDAPSVGAAVTAVSDALGAITILVNNAGEIEPQGLLHETDPDAWARNVSVNLIGAAAAARAVLPGMLEGGRGTIINLSSGAAHRPVRGWSAYGAAKAGLAMLTRSLDEEYRAKGVLAVGIAPGLVDTEMQAAIRAAAVNAVAKVPRASLAPATEAGAAIAYLCTGGAKRFAGKDLDIRDPAFREAAGLAPMPA
jgi:NAD(P)-dependent dehydrogenase (short-subunit alcohol dehydrogenase family)